MPGIPLLVARETSSSSIRSGEQMCRDGAAAARMSDEEVMAAEETLSVYCKPVELYNILQRRCLGNPSFLQRCLRYKIQAKNKRRIQMTVSLSVTLNGVARCHGLFPLYVMLGRLVSEVGPAGYSAVYRFTRACVLTNFAGVEGSAQAQAGFVLPEINKLASEAKSGSLVILLLSFAGAQSSMRGIDLTKGHLENIGGCCLLGKIPIESLYSLWEKSPNLSLGQRVEVILPVDMSSCFMKLSCLDEDKCVFIQIPSNSETVNASQVQVNVSAEEVGAKERSPYHLYTCGDISSSSLSQIIGLRAGNVIFNYRYYHNRLQKTEVTEDFSCPFCLAKCASYKGLRYHLLSSHDLFNFEFWVTEEFQAVNISVKTDIWRSEIVADGVDPKQQTFSFCSKKPKRKRSKNLVTNAKHVHPHIMESSLRVGAAKCFDRGDGGKGLQNNSMGAADCHATCGFDALGVSGSASLAYPDPECVESVSGNNLAAPAMLQFSKSKKLYIERPEMRNRSLLHKRQFFHSHRAQPMAIEQVVSDRDSEDEVDDDVADLEDRRMLDDFVDVTRDEKQMMHMWNSFVRKQRVLADGHIPWACEAFSRLYGHDLVQSPSLIWCWRLFMIKLWNHGLLDARTMNNCNIILEQFPKPEPIRS